MDKIMIPAMTWVDLENIVKWKTSQKATHNMVPPNEMFRLGESLEIASMEISHDLGLGECCGGQRFDSYKH